MFIEKNQQPEWVKTIRKKSYLSQRDFAKKLGVSGAYIGQVETGEAPLSDKVYNGILENFKDLVTDIKEGCIILDYYPDGCGSCGNGVFEFSTKKTQLAVPKESFFTRFSSVKQYFVVNAIGNSMEPLIFDGDKLIIEHYDGEQIKDNRPYLFCFNNEIFIKRLAKNVDELLIIPENKMFSVRKLEKEEMNEVDILGQVVGLMRDLR